ncbi:MAG: ABC transporter ATP-binding protein [Acidimicrobiales bacterium]
MRRLSHQVFQHKRDVVLALLAALLGSTCQTVVPLVEREIVDGVIVRHTSPLWIWLAVLVALAAVAFGAAYVRRYRGGRVALAVQYDLRNAMHDHLQVMDFENLDRTPTGQLVARANSDSTLVQGLLSFLPIMSGNVLMMLLSLGVMIYLSPLLAVVSVVIAPALLVVSYRMRWRVFPATWDGQQREGDMAQIVDEDVNGVRVVKAFGQEQREVERLASTVENLYGSQMRAVRLQARYQPLLEAIPALGQVGILALGGYLALRHEITLGTFLAFSTYIVQLVAPARQLAGVLAVAQQARAGVERIFQLIDLEPAIAERPDAADLPPIRGEVTFSEVHFAFGHGPPVLQGIDLHVAAGERVAIVGASGSGKSTLAMLVPRFYDPTAGSVLVDGRDLREVALRSLRRQIGVVFEESFLFSDSIRANIAYGRPGASREEVEAAARVAEAHSFIEQLPRGYETTVGERGLSLSGGQRQRIALARAVLSDPAILILDDATSSVDAKIEESINDALKVVMAGRTTILVAHRRSTLDLAERIVVLDRGAIVDEGTHDDLMARSPVYRDLLVGTEEDLAPRAGDRSEAPARSVGAPSIGAGRGDRGGWRLNLAPTPELLARVAALRPIRDTADVDLRRETRHQPNFRLGSVLGEFRRPLGIGLLLVVLDALATLLGPVLVKTGIDSGVSVGSRAVLFGAAAVFLVVTLADLVDEIGDTFITGKVAQRLMMLLRIRIWAQLQRLSLDYYESEMAGRIMTRMTTDVDQFESLIENGLLSALVSIVTFLGVGVALVVINLKLGLCTLSVTIPLGIATAVYRRRAAALYEVARERIAIVNADFQESLSGVRESQAFVHEAATVDRFHRLGYEYLDARVAAQRLVAIYFPFVQFLSGGADAIVLGVGASLVASGQLTTGALIAFILYIDLFFSPIQQLSQVFDSWQQTRVSLRRISDLMRLETLTPSEEEPVAIGRLRGDITFEDVHFSYPVPGGAGDAGRRDRDRLGPADDRWPVTSDDFLPPAEALRGVDLHIAAGETVALVGETGAGKSTVVKLLARFYDPVAGVVRIDGHDLRSVDIGEFRHQLGYVPQEAFLFSGSIRDNIAYGRPGASDAEVEAAARAVGAHDLIADLPGRYTHELSERGRSLSTGQRQLIALARAELVDPVVLLLDEATSNLDLATEARVATAMRSVAHGRTTVVIAHRLQTAMTADRIFVLDRGEVVETGSHAELLVAEGRYASMWNAFEAAGGGPRDGPPPSEAAGRCIAV